MKKNIYQAVYEKYPTNDSRKQELVIAETKRLIIEELIEQLGTFREIDCYESHTKANEIIKHFKGAKDE